MSELLSDEAQRLLQARRNAAAELKAIDNQDRPINDHDVCRLASCRLLIDSLNMRMLSPGDHPVNPGDLRAADAMLAEVLEQAGMRKIKVELQWIGAEQPPVCVKCGHVAYSDPVAEVGRSPAKPIEAIDPSEKAPTENLAPSKPVKALRPIVEPTFVKDSRPQAGNGLGNHGSAVWWSGQP